MFLGTSLGAVVSAVVRTCTAAVGSPCIGVDIGGASVTGGSMVLWRSTGDATLGVMGTSGTASVVGRRLDLSLFTHSLSLLGAISVGVAAANPDTLRGTGACMTGSRVGARTDVLRTGR